jgi:hypothetical protein
MTGVVEFRTRYVIGLEICGPRNQGIKTSGLAFLGLAIRRENSPTSVSTTCNGTSFRHPAVPNSSFYSVPPP